MVVLLSNPISDARSIKKLFDELPKVNKNNSNGGACHIKHSVFLFVLFHSYYSLCTSHVYKTMTNVPIPIRIHPINDFTVNSSCRNTNARISVITTLNLSIGTTFDASPICNAL